MPRLSEQIAQAKVDEGALAIYWLAQAGFVFKASSGLRVYIDAYFSNVVEKRFGFKRLMTCPISAEEVDADLFVCTHEHLDHMDIDALPVIAKHSRTHFAGPIECYKYFLSLNIPEQRCHLLEEGKSLEINGIEVQGVFADHGDLAVDALGIIFDFSGIKVYHTGDTAYRPEQFAPAIATRPDVLLPCINGKYGNLDARQAALLTKNIAPQVVIPTHFGMFVEHNGDCALFLKESSEQAPNVKVVKMEPGDEYIFHKAG